MGSDRLESREAASEQFGRCPLGFYLGDKDHDHKKLDQETEKRHGVDVRLDTT